MLRYRQKILVTRDVHSSFTSASIIPNETANSLRNGLLLNICNIRSPDCCIRVDNSQGFVSLKDDATLRKHGITLDFGYIKNKNATSVIDRGIQELEHELLQVDSTSGPVATLQLQLVIETLNTCIRNRGLSAKEILFQRYWLRVTKKTLAQTDFKQ